MNNDEKTLLPTLQGNTRALALLCLEICKHMSAAERKKIIGGLKEERDRSPSTLSDGTPENAACKEILELLILRLEMQG